MEVAIVIVVIVIIIVLIVASRVHKNVKAKAKRILAEGKITDRKEFEYVCSQLLIEAGDLTAAGKVEAKDLWDRLQALDRKHEDLEEGRHKKQNVSGDSALEILEKRYALGEISKEEYEEKREDLA